MSDADAEDGEDGVEGEICAMYDDEGADGLVDNEIDAEDAANDEGAENAWEASENVVARNRTQLPTHRREGAGCKTRNRHKHLRYKSWRRQRG